MSSPRCSGGPPWRRLHWADRTRVAAKPSVGNQSDLRACVDAGAGRSRSSGRCHLRGPEHLPRSWVSSSGESSWWCQCVREAGRARGKVGVGEEGVGVGVELWSQRVTIPPFLDRILRCGTLCSGRLLLITDAGLVAKPIRRWEQRGGFRGRAGKQNKSVRFFFCPQNINTSHNLTTELADVTSGLRRATPARSYSCVCVCVCL